VDAAGNANGGRKKKGGMPNNSLLFEEEGGKKVGRGELQGGKREGPYLL